jgi:hypothetical protein
MPMKLLSPSVNKDTQQAELSRKLLRIQEVEDMAVTMNAKLARAEADFSSAMALNQAKWLAEETLHQKEVQERTKEIEDLEKRKTQALIPIEIYKQEAETLMEKARLFAEEIRQRNEAIELLSNRLMEKLSEVSDREHELRESERKVELSRIGLDNQREAIALGSEHLTIQMQAFHEKQQQEEKDLLDRKTQVSLAEISFKAKTDKIKRDIQAIREWETRLKDREETLEREVNRRK